MTLPKWNVKEFGCLLRDDVQIASLLRTQLTASLPQPFVTRRADESAPLQLDYTIEVDDDGFRAWEQWTTYDLNDGSLPFTMFLPWGPEQPQVRCRLNGPWHAQHQDNVRWKISGAMQIEREGLPLWSGGAR
jgi:hypothetical protein